METSDSTPAAALRDKGFVALSCLALAFVLLESCLVQFNARPLAHTVVVSWGAMLIAGIGLRLASYRLPALADPAGTRPWTRPGALRSAGVSSLLPAALGYVGVHLVAFGLMTLFAIFTVALHLLPWSRMGVLRHGFGIPLLAWMAGAIAALWTGISLGHPLLTALAAWIMAGSAGAAWIRLIVLKKRERARSTATPGGSR